MQEIFEKIKERLEKQKENSSYITDGIANRRIYDNGIKNAIEIVNQVEEEYNNESVNCDLISRNGWIPCSERLPEERNWYLAVFQEPDTGFIGLPYIADYLLGAHTNYTTNEGWIIKDCTDHDGACEYYKDLLCVAWQPLPAPYQPKGE